MEATNCRLLLNLLVLLLCRGAFSAGAADTLGKGGNITGDETLVSAGGTFTMGFFSLGAPTNKRYYLGIWFSVSSDAVCWVANRERPLFDKPGVLVVSDTGSLVVLQDDSGEIAWSSNTTTSSSSVSVQLLETGNLVVRDQQGAVDGDSDSDSSSGMVLWQSFDHPSNTLLSGMKVGKNSWNGAEWHLRSWRSADDPSPGPYRRVLDTGGGGGLVDFVVLKDNAPTYRAGPWNGRFFSGIPDVQGYADLVTLGVTISRDEISYGYTSKPGSNLTRLVVNEAGTVTRFAWNNGTRQWDIKFEAPKGVCDHYGHCGPFGLCDLAAETTSPCGCLRGFFSTPASSSTGCQRKARLQCSSNGGTGTTTTDGFVAVKGVKLPDTHNASVDTGTTVEECERRCRANCSCLAYAAADIRGGSIPSGCVMWTESIIDLRLQGQQDLYLRLAKSELGDKNDDFPLAAVAATVASVVAALALFLLIYRWRKRSVHPTPTAGPSLPTVQTVHSSIPLVTIKSATGNFSTRNVIGEGAFSIVYKGKLPRGRQRHQHQLPQGLAGRTIAVKRLKPIGGLPDAKVSYFTREREVMTGLRQHPNVLRLLAYCEEANERIVVYEYMDRKSLDAYIFGKPKERVLLNWQRRLQIIQGIADGVKHLHEGEESVGSVIHRDLKPANVLLDGGWKAKVADFGTAKQLQLPAGATGTRTIIGTPGYMAPEYVQSEGGETTLKCDVYSFGVTLLETLSGRMNWDRERPSLVSEAWRLWVDRSATALLDSVVTPAPAELEFAQLRRCIQIGLLCIQERPDERPAMSTVVEMLSSSTTELVEPTLPLVINNGALATFLEANLASPTPTVHETVDFT